MSAARLTALRLSTRPLLRSPTLPQTSALTRNRLLTTSSLSTAGGILRTQNSARIVNSRFGTQIYRSHSNAVRALSFGRVVPKLFSKLFVLFRVPAAFGATVLGGVAYINHQLQQAGNYTLGILQSAGEVVDSAYVTATGKAGELWGGLKEGADKLELPTAAEMPEWMQKLMQFGAGAGTGGDGANNGGDGGEGGNRGNGAKVVAAASGAATAFGYSTSDEEGKKQAAKDDQMMVLTKKMIEIRNILNRVGQTGALTLPSIVVIGSQSSGKSSVLEAIVGHEFLPKGANMVTRRPIELTLVNTPEGTSEYGEFPDLGLGKLSDFSSIQRTLTDLNLAVPEEDCVSDDPIRLNIYSPTVPDLSMIDLPGYIQIAGENQPEELKGKIAALCDKYIQAPNVILAISAADVDLANSTALRASRRVDPRGERTIGVITKMDLVEPERALNILKDKNYPLRLGYVGVVCKVPSHGGLAVFSRNTSISSAITKNENAYFGAHPEFAQDGEAITIGTFNLKKKLMTVLEQTMAQSLQGTSDAIHQELEEATYEFKVQYNDRMLTAETYLAESLDAFKHSFKEFTESFGRPQVKELLKHELDQKVLDLLAQRYWNRPITDQNRPRTDDRALSELPTSEVDSAFWHRKLDASTSSLTKLGIGRMSTNVLATALTQHMERLVETSTFREHPFARSAIQEATNSILNERFYSTADQVENCIKPYKFEIDVEDREWDASRSNVQQLLKEELRQCEESLKGLRNSVGNKKLGQAMNFVEKARADSLPLRDLHERREATGISQALLERGREAVFLKDRSELIKMRLQAVKSKQCGTKENKYYCPEIFLDVVADKLTATAVLFLNVELLSEFYYNFPRELDNRLGRHLTPEQIDAFAREDPKIRKHIDLQQRKQLLELALQKMDSVMALENSKGIASGASELLLRPGRGGLKDNGRSRWGGIF